MKRNKPFRSLKVQLPAFPSSLHTVLGITLLAAACASEPPVSSQAQSAAAPAANAVASAAEPAAATEGGSEIECRSVKVTGTNFARRVCETKDYWNATRRAERRISDEFGRQSNENSTIVQPGSSRGLPQ